jgi:hypothetical protein
VPRDAASASAFWTAVRGLPWVLRERRPVAPEVEAQIQLLEGAAPGVIGPALRRLRKKPARPAPELVWPGAVW